MRIGKYQFSPGLIPTIATVALLAVLVSLGNWQMGRAAVKQKDRDLRERSKHAGVVKLTTQAADVKSMIGRTVEFKGVFVHNRQAALVNVKYKGKPGLFVLTPARIVHAPPMHVLVVRGWIPHLGSMQKVPRLPEAPRTVQFISGVIDKYPAVGIKRHAPDAGFEKRWPKMLSYADHQWYEKVTGLKLMPFVVRQSGKTTATLVRDWSRFPAASLTMPAEKHLSYAFQWYSLALVLLVIYLIVNVKRYKPGNG